MKNHALKLLTFLIASRIVLFILPFLTTIILFPEKAPIDFSEFIRHWNRWDAPHYLYIAQHGYTNVGDESNFIVFLPLYPMLVRFLNVFFQDFVITAIFISNLFFVLGSFLFLQLIKIDFSNKFSLSALALLITFPTSFFFSAPYAESLFFLLVVSSFYFARKENFIAAGFVAGLAAFTRPFGLFLAPSLLFEFLQAKNKKVVGLIAIFLPTLIFLSIYLYINYVLYNNPLAFQGILLNNWYKRFSLPTAGIVSSWKLALSGPLNYHTLMVGWAEALPSTISLILIPFAFLKLRRSLALYYTLCVLLFTSTNFILSSPRYLLSLPPLFVLLAFMVGSNKIWLFISAGLLFYLTLIFTSGQWVF